MRLALMADGDVGLRIVSHIAETYPQDVAIVVTTSDNAISSLARENSMRTAVWTSGAEIIEELSDSDPDMGLLAWWPNIVKEPAASIPKQGWLNTHPSWLPYNRGKHYNFWALVEQAPFGVTLHFIDDGVDTGDIVAQDEIFYDWTDTGGSLYIRAQDAMLNLFRRTYPSLRAGQFERRPQARTAGSKHTSKELGPASALHLEEHYRLRDLLNLLRARTFEGMPACTFEEDGCIYEVRVDIRRLPDG